MLRVKNNVEEESKKLGIMIFVKELMRGWRGKWMKLDGEGVEREGKRYECKNGKQVWSSVLHPTLPNPAHFTTSQHTTKEGSVHSILSAMPGLNTCDKN